MDYKHVKVGSNINVDDGCYYEDTIQTASAQQNGSEGSEEVANKDGNVLQVSYTSNSNNSGCG